MPFSTDSCDYYTASVFFESLKQQRDSTKTFLRSYADPVLNAWAKLISDYQSGNVYLADSALREANRFLRASIVGEAGKREGASDGVPHPSHFGYRKVH